MAIVGTCLDFMAASCLYDAFLSNLGRRTVFAEFTGATWKDAQQAGWSDEQLAEALAFIGLTVFTVHFLNYAQRIRMFERIRRAVRRDTQIDRPSLCACAQVGFYREGFFSPLTPIPHCSDHSTPSIL